MEMAPNNGSGCSAARVPDVRHCASRPLIDFIWISSGVSRTSAYRLRSGAMGPSTKESWRDGCLRALDAAVEHRMLRGAELASYRVRVRTARQARSPEGDRA